MAKPLPSKQKLRVRFSLAAPTFRAAFSVMVAPDSVKVVDTDRNRSVCPFKGEIKCHTKNIGNGFVIIYSEHR
jgi:hypothetical protein